MVRPARPRAAVARHARPVRRLAERNHAPADAGGNRQAVLPAIPGRLAHNRRVGPSRRAAGPASLGRIGLLSPGAAASPGGPANRRRARRPLPHRSAVRPATAGHRPLHGGGHPLHRLRPAAADPGGQHRAGLQPACWPTTAKPRQRPARSCCGRRPRPCCPARDVGRFNQALMELGSEVCRSRAPGCDVCPAVGALPCPTPWAAKRDSSSQAAAAIRRGCRGGRARPPPRSRALDPMARRPPLGGAVGFSPLCRPRQDRQPRSIARWSRTCGV